jgi:hypothetical protein
MIARLVNTDELKAEVAGNGCGQVSGIVQTFVC